MKCKRKIISDLVATFMVLFIMTVLITSVFQLHYPNLIDNSDVGYLKRVTLTKKNVGK